MNPSCFVKLLLRIYSLKPCHSTLVLHQCGYSIASVSALCGIHSQSQVGTVLGYFHTPLSFTGSLSKGGISMQYLLKTCGFSGLHEQWEVATEDVNYRAGSSHRGLIPGINKSCISTGFKKIKISAYNFSISFKPTWNIEQRRIKATDLC